MHANTATLRPGGTGSDPLSKPAAYASAFRRSSSVTLMVISFREGERSEILPDLCRDFDILIGRAFGAPWDACRVAIGVGIDAIEVDRFAAALSRHPRLADRCFTESEAAYCRSRAFPPQHFAARFAAKEAVGKALGIGMTRWREVEVVRGRGAPVARLSGRYAERAAALGVTRVLISLSH